MRLALVLLFALLSAATSSAGAPLGVGMRVPALTLADQHGVDGSLGPTTRRVLFNRDMDSAKIVQEALGDNPTPLLDAAGAVVVSDISGMPSLITKLFALPAMRKRPYRMLLDRDGRMTADFPFEKGKVTVLSLNDLAIARVQYVESADALRALLHQAAATPAPAPRSGEDAR